MQRIWVLGLVFLAGCCGFQREWKRAAALSPSADALAGRWEGAWRSEKNGHNGRLRCVMTPSTNGLYNASFHAKYWKILSYSYTVPLAVQPSNGVHHFDGEANLGKLAGGLYRYQGTVADTNFHATYRSRYDHGYFRMNRAP